MKVYKNEKAKQNIYRTYDELLSMWGVPFKENDVPTTYGTTHVITCGNEGNPPLVLFHGVGDDSALMWVYNAKKLSKNFHIYAVDTMGGPGKSCPNENYNKDFDEIKLIDEVLDSFHIERTYVAGVSNGSYMTQHYGIMRPDRVIKMVCMSGSISVKENGSVLKNMMKVFLPEALFPTKKNIIKLIVKMSGDNSRAFTDNSTIMEHFGYLLKGFNNKAMFNHKIEIFNEEQLNLIKDKSLFIIGECDPLGDKDKVRAKLDKYHMNYMFIPGAGHGINHEMSEKINKTIIDFFRQQ